MHYCVCGTGKFYMDCCGAFISHLKTPSTPEELMRSRYTAYTEINLDYIANTMKSPALDTFNIEDARTWAQSIHWTGLEIIKTSSDTKKGIVEFIANYVLANEKHSLHEVSEFSFENGNWYYVDGIVEAADSVKKIGRNDICPCGSNKKYKKCCINKVC